MTEFLKKIRTANPISEVYLPKTDMAAHSYYDEYGLPKDMMPSEESIMKWLKGKEIKVPKGYFGTSMPSDEEISRKFNDWFLSTPNKKSEPKPSKTDVPMTQTDVIW